MPDLARFWTREEVLALPADGNRYELVDGALLVTPSPRPVHQFAVGQFFRLLDPYVGAHRIGALLSSPADLDLGSGQLVQPDLFVIGGSGGRRPRDWDEVGVPLLVVEVLSPATARHDRGVKRRRYQRAGVAVCWIVDVDAGTVEVWTPPDAAPLIVDDTLTWQPAGGVPPLRIDLPGCFRTIRGE